MTNQDCPIIIRCVNPKKNKLVLLINDGVASIVFNHKVIPYAENIDIKDALSFLYSLIEEMKYILDFYNNLSEAEKSSIDFVEFAYKFIEIQMITIRMRGRYVLT